VNPIDVTYVVLLFAVFAAFVVAAMAWMSRRP
jgi:hypothetical protein